MSSGDATFAFQVVQDRPLPCALRLLLTHPGYFKVGFDVEDEKLGHVNRDFETAIEPIFDARDCAHELNTDDIISAYEAVGGAPLSPHFHVNEVVRSDWNSPVLSEDQLRYAVFVAFAARFLFLNVAKPEGFPPKTRYNPVDVAKVLTHMTCPLCGAKMHSRQAIQVCWVWCVLCDVCVCVVCVCVWCVVCDVRDVFVSSVCALVWGVVCR